jgi:hypothetical protein
VEGKERDDPREDAIRDRMLELKAVYKENF